MSMSTGPITFVFFVRLFLWVIVGVRTGGDEFSLLTKLRMTSAFSEAETPGPVFFMISLDSVSPMGFFTAGTPLCVLSVLLLLCFSVRGWCRRLALLLTVLGLVLFATRPELDLLPWNRSGATDPG